jgi:hypothetical protein
VLRSRAFRTALLLAAALLPAAVQADVIYTNFGDGDSFLAGSGLIVTRDSAAWSSVALAFVPAASYSLTSIEFAASTLVPRSTGASLAVFEDDGGHPAARPLEYFALDGLAAFGNPSPLLKVPSGIHPLLEAGQTYWVGMNAEKGGLAVWNQTTALTAGFSSTDGEGNWSVWGGVQGAVQLDGKLVFETPLPVAEPAPVPDPGVPSPPDDPFLMLFAASGPPREMVIAEPGPFLLIGCGLALLTLGVRRQFLPRFTNKK